MKTRWMPARCDEVTCRRVYIDTQNMDLKGITMVDGIYRTYGFLSIPRTSMNGVTGGKCKREGRYPVAPWRGKPGKSHVKWLAWYTLETVYY